MSTRKRENRDRSHPQDQLPAQRAGTKPEDGAQQYNLPDDSLHREPDVPKLTRGVEDEARKNGMTVFLCNTDEDAAIEKSYLETMKQRWIDGFIVCSLSSDAPAHPQPAR